MSAADATRRVKEKAAALGLPVLGIARAGAAEGEGSRLREWLTLGYQGTMTWLEREPEKRADPRLVVPGAQSVIVAATNYHTNVRHSPEKGRGKISRYAWGGDYHDILGMRLKALWGWMLATFPGYDGRWYVDTGPVMEKAWAQRAGVGWQGKHTNLITRDKGSWVFLGVIITTLELQPDEPATDHCGTCTRCLDACPTDAIVAPYVLDAARCISYLTIEHKGPIPPDLAGKFDGWIYGCDICQDVCPWNVRFAEASGEPEFQPRHGNDAPLLAEWAAMSQEEFSARFKGSPMKRTKHAGLIRTLRAVMADPANADAASHRREK
jgi:epoxyqueuosine reductase